MNCRLGFAARLLAGTGFVFCLASLVAPVATAAATGSVGTNEAQCVANFQQSGDPRNGATYKSFVVIPRIDIHSALGQMEKFAQDQKFVVGAETYQGDEGQLIVSQKDSGFLNYHHGFPVIILANAKTNRLTVGFRLNQGQTTTVESARGVICGMLSKVTMDAAGAALAASTRAQTHSDEIIDIKARDLSNQVDRAMIGHADSLDSIAARYMGRTYRIDGQVRIPDGLQRAQEVLQATHGSKSLNIHYDTRMNNGLDKVLGVKGPDTGMAVICRTDPAQLDRFMELRDEDYATLIGKVVDVTYNSDQLAGSIILACHYEK